VGFLYTCKGTLVTLVHLWASFTLVTLPLHLIAAKT